jgi:hypothetical protein
MMATERERVEEAATGEGPPAVVGGTVPLVGDELGEDESGPGATTDDGESDDGVVTGPSGSCDKLLTKEKRREKSHPRPSRSSAALAHSKVMTHLVSTGLNLSYGVRRNPLRA